MRSHRAILAITLLAMPNLTGCGPDQPKTHPVTGKVTLAGGNVKQLAGHYVEAVLDTDPLVRSSGIIGPDGGFTLETLHAGEILKGAREGKYQVRIVRAEEDDNGQKLRKPPIANQYFQFQGSGLSLTVPATNDLTLELRSR
ncbi:MAG: hypothetical protein C0467_30330 [Planctomycetaceae bacterium]|nr:hypothetical protein [Planctomycetaceae bacterium]